MSLENEFFSAAIKTVLEKIEQNYMYSEGEYEIDITSDKVEKYVEKIMKKEGDSFFIDEEITKEFPALLMQLVLEELSSDMESGHKD